MKPKIKTIKNRYLNAYSSWTDKQYKKLIEEYEKGECVGKLAKIFGRSRSAIRLKIKKHYKSKLK